MRALLERSLMILIVFLGTAGGRALAEGTAVASAPRIALVVGNGAYPAGALPTAVNDAGLVAETLAEAGFAVTAARDLDGEALRRTVHDFLDEAASVGPGGIGFVYVAGRALQFDGENYLVPVDAKLGSDASVVIETMRLNDILRSLAALPLAIKVVVLDGAYADAGSENRYGNGLAVVDPGPGTLVAFNAAPGTAAKISEAAYGAYAEALTRTMKQGGVPVDEVFARVRLAVNTATHGAVTPWEASKLTQTFHFFDRAPDAPAMGSAQVPFASLRKRPLRDFSPEQAYDIALARDSLPAYQEYLTVFPDAPLARRVRVMMAVRREALFWREALTINAPPAFWTYLRRYPKGPHAAEAGRRLTRLGAGKAPPAGFRPIAFEVAPPPDSEPNLLERRFSLDAPEFEAPPPPPLFLLPPSAEVALVPPPTPSPGPGLLPIPDPAPIPYVRPITTPGTIAPPRGVKDTYRPLHPPAAAAPSRPTAKEPAPQTPAAAVPPPTAEPPTQPSAARPASRPAPDEKAGQEHHHPRPATAAKAGKPLPDQVGPSKKPTGKTQKSLPDRPSVPEAVRPLPAVPEAQKARAEPQGLSKGQSRQIEPRPAAPQTPDARRGAHPPAAKTGGMGRDRPGRPDCGHPGQPPCRP